MLKYEKPRLVYISELAEAAGLNVASPDCADGSSVLDTCGSGGVVTSGCNAGGIPTVACADGGSVLSP
jgi:hypothetical protein